MRKPLPVRLLIGTLIRLLLICLVVGLFMAFFGIRPGYLLTDLTATFWRAWQLVAVLVNWAASYILLGASVVIPVAIIVMLLRFVRR